MAVYSVCANAVLIAELCVGGIIGLIQNIAGILYGERDYYGIRTLCRRTLAYSYLAIAVLIALFLAAPQAIAGLFGIARGEMLSLTRTALRIFCLGFPFYVYNKFLMAYYQTILQPMLSTVVTVLQGFAVIVPLSLLGIVKWGLPGVCAMAAVSEAVTILLATAFRIAGQKRGRFEDGDVYMLPSIRDEKFLELGEADNWSSLSVAEQIFDAVSLRSRYTLDYVCFESTDSKLGGLDTKGRSVKYFYDATGSRESLEDVRFRPSGEASGAFSVNFYAYDTNGKEFPGVLTVTVQQHAGSMDVMLVTAKDEPVALSTEAFEDFWAESYSKGDLDRISFLEMPNSAEGILYTDFTSLSSTGARVRSGELFYVDPGRRDTGIDEVTFVPGSRQTEYVIIPFTAYGTSDRGNSATRDGELYIFISRDSVAPITWTVTPGASCKLDARDFLAVFQAATDSKSTSFYIQLLDLPDSGTLYANYNASTNRGTRLTESNVSGWSFYYSGRGDLISDMVYVPGTAASDTVRYVACDSQGKMLYVGELCFTASSLKVPYKCTSAGVSFRAADFETLNGTAAKLSTVSFTPPPAAQGALYYGRTALSAGTAITGDSVWFNVSSSNTAVNANSMNGVSFVPRAGYSGEVSIPFSAYDVSGRKLAGTVKITVTATSTTDPVNPTNPTNPTNPSTPAPDPGFSDVPKSSSTSWYFNQLATLVASDVIGGYPDGSFQPGRAVTYGEALKMIMRAAGYEELAPTGKHWASGYLSRAVSDGLLASSQVNLDMAITRYTVAEVAAKALRVQGYNLPASTRTVSPFSDMTMEVSSAPYVLALVDAKIVQGTTLSNGNVVYYGVNAFRRSEVAVVVYNMMAYRSAG